MFQVLAFVYENYDPGESWPEPEHLERKLTAVGFESDEIDDALVWLKGLDGIAHPSPILLWLRSPQASSMRIYTPHEQLHLGPQALGFLHFLETTCQLPAPLREVIIERAMAAAGAPVSLDDLKIIVLMVYWRLGQEPDTLLQDELCSDHTGRTVH
jgi:Smg protein